MVRRESRNFPARIRGTGDVTPKRTWYSKFLIQMIVGSTDQSCINCKSISQSDFLCAPSPIWFYVPPPLGSRPSLFHNLTIHMC